MGNPAFFHCNRRLAVVPAGGGTPRSLTEAFDEHAFLLDWKPDGIYFWGFQKTSAHLFRVHPDNHKVTRLTGPHNLQALGFSLTHDGRQLAFTAGSPSSLSEVFVSEVNDFAPRKLTDMTAQTRSLILGKSELISWKSQDGTAIEGVLTKPADFLLGPPGDVAMLVRATRLVMFNSISVLSPQICQDFSRPPQAAR